MNKENGIGTIIKQARLQKGYTQEALAKLVGVQKSAVAKWENGRVSEIKRTNLANLSSVLGLDPFILSGGEDTEKPTAADDGLSDERKELIDRIKTLPEDQIQLLLQVARSIK